MTGGSCWFLPVLHRIVPVRMLKDQERLHVGSMLVWLPCHVVRERKTKGQHTVLRFG